MIEKKYLFTCLKIQVTNIEVRLIMSFNYKCNNLQLLKYK